MKARLFAKVVAVTVFALGAVMFVNASLTASKDQPKSFVITYRITRSENGQPPVDTGLSVKIVSAEGEWKETKVQMSDSGHPKQVSVRFLDKTAAYNLETDHLNYSGSSESVFHRDKIAHTADWVTSSPLFVKEDSMLGLKVYTTHQDISDGFVEQAFSPVTRGIPLLYRERSDKVETTEEAVSVQFRDVSPDEIKPPSLPISFEWSKQLENAMLSNPENAEMVNRLIAERETVTKKLQAQGRIK